MPTVAKEGVTFPIIPIQTEQIGLDLNNAVKC